MILMASKASSSETLAWWARAALVFARLALLFWRFLSGFGGRIKTRLLIRRTRLPFRALQLLKRHYARDETQLFT